MPLNNNEYWNDTELLVGEIQTQEYLAWGTITVKFHELTKLILAFQKNNPRNVLPQKMILVLPFSGVIYLLQR